ncbi:recombinase family protein [Paenibacillus crassostreae]|uniref:Resolvase/invertase-type recombinase catalytic domain-containing protein n=1 Tax=Paenibacillus crassostreae TaxID=1763538 RepID=A0A167BCC7_9BACL|nr:recombinase family protein [Paenibacillus crassostreae]AOZ92972.1 hypothetical protein LPB68_12615 [Paenibacillus crassostreae]OAB71939.1 hypothetical protein PNBC_18275 [Paenibacillus crassostreae]
MLHDISKDSDIYKVLVWKLSRQTRKLSHLLNIVDILEQYNTGLILTNDGLDPLVDLVCDKEQEKEAVKPVINKVKIL